MNKPIITPETIVKRLHSIVDYLDLQTGSLKAVPTMILTGSMALKLTGQLTREPTDIDVLIVCHPEDRHMIRNAIYTYGTICSEEPPKQGYNTDEETLFISINIHGIVFDFWVTSNMPQVLDLKLPDSLINIAHPDYTWKRKLNSCLKSENKDYKKCQTKGMADIQEILDTFKARELKLLTYILQDNNK